MIFIYVISLHSVISNSDLQLVHGRLPRLRKLMMRGFIKITIFDNIIYVLLQCNTIVVSVSVYFVQFQVNL